MSSIKRKQVTVRSVDAESWDLMVATAELLGIKLGYAMSEAARTWALQKQLINPGLAETLQQIQSIQSRCDDV